MAPFAVEAISEDSLRRFRARWLALGDSFADTVPPYLEWLASQADTAALAHLVKVAESKEAAAVTRAFLALARSDTAAAVARFLAFPDSSLPMWNSTRLTKARLLRQTGRLRDAARVLRPTLSPWGSDYYPADSLWHLERGRTYERLGDTVGARQAYRTVLIFGDTQTRSCSQLLSKHERRWCVFTRAQNSQVAPARPNKRMQLAGASDQMNAG